MTEKIYQASTSCPECGAEIFVPVAVWLRLQTGDDGSPVFNVSADPDLDAPRAHYEHFHRRVNQ